MEFKPLSLLLILLLLAMLTGIFIGGNLAMFILAYIFIFVIMLCCSLYTAATLHVRLLRIFIYAAVMVLQILYAILITYNYEGGLAEFTLLKLTSTIIILLPLIIEELFFIKERKRKG